MVSASSPLRYTLLFFALVLVSSCRKQEPDTLNSQIANLNSTAPATNGVPSITAPSASPEPMAASPSASPPPPSSVRTASPTLSQEDLLLHDAIVLQAQGHSDPALAKVSSALQLNPKSLAAYSVRGQIYTEMKNWDQAKQAFEMVLQLDNKNVVAQFNLSELKFRQKDYDGARPGFFALEKDPDLGDFASFKVFLCDLFGGHEEVAKREFDAFNQAGSNPSFYFGNVAWYLYHKQPEQARGWWMSGVHIYASKKVYLYTSSLTDLGYLPLPPRPPPQ